MFRVSCRSIYRNPDPVFYAVDRDTLMVCLPTIIDEFPGQEVIIQEVNAVTFPEKAEKVIVYEESGSSADKIAIFSSEHLYNCCCDGLIAAAKADRMDITESVSPDEESWKEPLWTCYKDKIIAEETYGKKFWMKD